MSASSLTASPGPAGRWPCACARRESCNGLFDHYTAAGRGLNLELETMVSALVGRGPRGDLQDELVGVAVEAVLADAVRGDKLLGDGVGVALGGHRL